MKFTVGTKITDHKPLKLDADILADTRALLCASSGGGKSRLLRLIAEQVAESIQTIIIDPEGEFPTLREKLDILVVGENGDVQANVKSAALLARRLAETGVSAVLDIYDLPGKGDPWDKRRAFVAEFLNSLMNLPKSQNHPMLIIVDEAHQFAPEGKGSDSTTASRSAINSLMSAGRKRGFGGILATQRISKIHKDPIADARNIFIGGTTLDIDQERAGDMLGMNKRESVLLRDLAPGQFYCYGPATGSREIFQFISGDIKTTHPKAGQRASIQVPKASTKIAAISEKLSDLPTEAQNELDTVDLLKRENNRLQREMAARPVQIESKVEIKEIEVPVIQEGQIEALANILLGFDEIGKGLKSEVDSLNRVMVVAKEFQKKNMEPIRIYQNSGQVGVNRSNGKDLTVYTKVEKRDNGIALFTDSGTISGPEQRILDAIAWFESIGNFAPLQTAVAFLAGYTYGGGAFNNPRGSLRTKGLVEYKASQISFTEKGRSLANTPKSFLTVADLQDHVFAILPGPECKILSMLISYDGRPVEKSLLAELCGYKEGGAFNNPLGRLRTLGLIEYPAPKQARAMPFLFLR